MKDKIKISTQANLQRFLKILAEESVTKAQVDLSSERDRQRQVARGLKSASGAKYVKEEDEDSSKSAAPTKPASPTPPAAEPVSDEAPIPEVKPEPTQNVVPGDVTASLDALVRAIKEIRSGLSVKDSVVEDKMEAYFDRLSEPEQLALVITLKSISQIMSKPGEVDVDSLAEPETYDIVTAMTQDKVASQNNNATSTQTSSSTGQTTQAGEDTGPPIKVGQPVSEMYRSKIKKLLSRV